MRNHDAAVFASRGSAIVALILAGAASVLAQGANQANAAASAIPAGASDPLFQDPYIDKDEWRDTPVRHRYMHGGFRNTDLRFSFYLPDQKQYQGRFFQYVAPAPGPEDTALDGTGENNRIAFAFDSGGYLVESNMGGKTNPKDDSITGFRGSAAAADYSRVVALKLFGGKRPCGYIYGGSGGGYRTMAAIENTAVWDGAVPYVIGSPRAMQVMVHGHSRAKRVLRDKIPRIVDALDAGGSGDIYAGLTKDEADALREVTRFGYPPRTWAFELSVNAPPSSLPGTGIDPGYFSDFWNKPGYEGSDPHSFAARARIQFPAKVVRVLTADAAVKAGIRVPTAGNTAFINPVGEDFARSQQQSGQVTAPTPAPLVGLELAKVPDNADVSGAVLLVNTGLAAGKSISLKQIVGNVALTGGDSAAVLGAIRSGDEIQIDNSDSLAREVILRYQVPSRDYVVWNQYRDGNGNPLTPQRPLQPESAIAGTVQNGKFKAKVIVVASLMDEAAHPWNADWYRTRVKEQLGSKIDSRFRIWFTDNALHGDGVQVGDPARIVSYLGILHQALRDVAAWVEKGVPPPASTNYQLVDGQVVVPVSAAARGGIQPIVALTANGEVRAEVQSGQTVTFSGAIELPPGTGRIIKAEWDFDGAGTFPVVGEVRAVSPTRAIATATYTFTTPGTHFISLRATSQRQGDTQTPWGRVRNIARARVIVQ